MFRKHADDIPELTLPKWPFILGDLLLVATALAIAILGNWQLTDWQVVACVLAVALGAALFVLPFIVEYLAREQENSSVSDQHNAILASHVKELEARTAVMADQITRLSKTQSDTPKATAPAFDAAALQVIEDRLDRQAKQLEAAEQNLEKMRAAAANPKPAPAKLAPAPEKQPAPAATPKEKPASKSKTEARPRKPADSQLLKRAIHEKQDRAAQAVDRIIESKPSEDKKETPQVEPEKKDADAAPKPEANEAPKPKLETRKPAPAAPKPKAVETPKPDPKPDSEPAAPKVEPKPTSEAKPTYPEPEAIAPLKLPDPKPKPTPAPATEAKVESKPEPEAQSQAGIEDKTTPEAKPAPKPEAEAAPSLFGADEAPGNPVPAKKRRSKKNETACTVNSLIGIGNKPYLRGSGGGLNWDSGVVMEFEAIGKWRWNVPADLDGPIEVQVYRNDEDPDTSGKHTLKPGEALVIDAKF